MNDNGNNLLLKYSKSYGMINICLQHSIVPMFDNIFLSKLFYSPLILLNRSKLYKSKYIDYFLGYGNFYKKYTYYKNKKFLKIGNINNDISLSIKTENKGKKNTFYG